MGSVLRLDHMTLQLEAAPKLCGSCGTENPFDAPRCESCGRDRFAPLWVRALRGVDHNFFVQVTEPHEESESTAPVLSLYKFWRGGHANFSIYKQSHWERVKEIVDSELLERLGWAPRQEIAAALGGNGEASNGSKAKTVLAEDPRLLLTVAETLAASPLAELDLASLGDARERIATLAGKVEDVRRVATHDAIENVSEDKTTAAQQLALLIGDQAHGELIAANLELRRRVGVLELLKERLYDERSYKIVNHRSAIHRLLERAVWIFDERCWLLGNNKELRVALDRAAAANDRPYAKKPPDFVCAVNDGHLLIASVKPPQSELSVADLDHLEQQVTACRALATFDSFEAILVGESLSEELKATLDLRDVSFKVMTYTQLLDEPLRRYSARLEALSAA
jgi:hypothetical protein